MTVKSEMEKFSHFLRLAFFRSPNYMAGVSGWTINQDGSAEFNNVTIRLGTIISGTNLYYSSLPPAPGNLVASESPAGGTDSAGNVYLAGQVTYTNVGGTFFAAQSSAGQINFLTAASETGPWSLQESIKWNNSTNFLELGPAGAPTLEVADGNNTLLTRSGVPLAIVNGIAPAGVAGEAILYASNSRLRAIQSSGSDFPLSGGQTDTTPITVTQALFTPLTNAYPIPSGDPHVGTVYRGKAWGSGTWGSTQQQLNLQWVMTNASGIISIAATAFNASQAFRWEAECWILFKAVGALGTYNDTAKIWASATGAPVAGATGATDIRRDTDVAVDTTGNRTFGLQARWGSTTGAPTITCEGSVFERTGP